MQRYYKQIHDMTPLSEQEMNAHLAEESRVRGCRELGVCVLQGQAGALWSCRSVLTCPPCPLPQKYQNEFNTNVAMAEIYKYAKRYRPQVSTPCYPPFSKACLLLGKEK